jgi:dUTP pyrophosphatase
MTESPAPSLPVAGALSREQLLARILESPRPLVTDVRDVESQIQPNGFDLTLQSVSRHRGPGAIGVDNRERVLPELEELPFDADGWVNLEPGIYHIVYNEIVDIPANLMALGRPRSSLGRSGVTIHTAVWDAGYRGRSTSLLSVLNPAGFRVQRNARVMQLVFFGLAEATVSGYDGAYQHENTRER